MSSTRDHYIDHNIYGLYLLFLLGYVQVARVVHVRLCRAFKGLIFKEYFRGFLENFQG